MCLVYRYQLSFENERSQEATDTQIVRNNRKLSAMLGTYSTKSYFSFVMLKTYIVL